MQVLYTQKLCNSFLGIFQAIWMLISGLKLLMQYCADRYTPSGATNKDAITLRSISMPRQAGSITTRSFKNLTATDRLLHNVWTRTNVTRQPTGHSLFHYQCLLLDLTAKAESRDCCDRVQTHTDLLHFTKFIERRLKLLHTGFSQVQVSRVLRGDASRLIGVTFSFFQYSNKS